jgi:hypothetical protein
MKRSFGIFIGSILFGLAVGFVMYLPTPEVVINGGAVNLTVMTSLWLGAMVSVQTPVKEAILEVIVAVVCFCFVAAAMQGFEYFLVLGFMVQGHWALMHANGQRGVKVHSWFPILAVGANVGMAIAPLYHFWSSL